MTEQFWKSKVITKRYEKRGKLGRGGIGTVYLAHDRTLDKLVAVKVLNADLSVAQLRRFQQEGKVSGKLKHRNIVSVLDFGVTEKNEPYLMMEYLRGGSLADAIADGPLESTRAIPIFLDICQALAHSHGVGILHRDLKPENVILSESESGEQCVKVVDFGLARVAEADAELTHTGAMIGSPLYVSPEQGEGGKTDERSDIYSMGCMMYHVLSGTVPFFGTTPIETILMHKNETPEPLKERAVWISDELEDVVMVCLEKDPANRFDSFKELKIALEKTIHFELQLREPTVSTIIEDKQPEPPAVDREIVPMGIVRVLAVLLIPAVVAIYMLVNRSVDLGPTVEVKVPERPTKAKGLGFSAAKNFEVSRSSNSKLHFTHGNLDITDKDLRELSKVKLIGILDVDRCPLTGTGFSLIPKTVIENLELDESGLTDEGLKQVAKIKGLNRLAMREVSEVTDEGIKNLSKNRTINRLLYGGPKLTEESIKYLSDGPPLFKLDLKQMKISPKGVKYIAEIATLRELQFHDCTMMPGAWDSLKQLKRLNYLCVATQKLERTELKSIFALPVPNLAFYDAIISGKDLSILAEASSRLRTVRVISPDSTNMQRAQLQRLMPDKEMKISSEQLMGIFGSSGSSERFLDQLQVE